jgi:maleylpyruvate isomerase
MPKAEVRTAIDQLNALLTSVDDDAARGPSGLLGWSRGHVMAHLANFSTAMTRQVDEALQGRLVEMYDGGRPARDAAIEADAATPAEELKARVATATSGLVAAWEKVDDWSRPVSHRNGDLAATVYAGWREVAIHTVDLDLGPTSDTWSAEFCLHLLDFLRPRVPAHTRLVLDAGDVRWEEGGGQVRVVQGKLTDLTAWMAGRRPVSPLVGELPDLSPWP